MLRRLSRSLNLPMHPLRLPAFILSLSLAFAPALLTPIASAQAPTAAAAKSAVKVTAATDRADAQYHVGETVTFTISIDAGSEAAPKTVTCVLSNDGWKPEPPKQVAVVDGKATLTGTLKEPGFLLLRASLPGTTAAAMAGAAFDPLQIKPSLPVPDDFDAFWAAQKKKLAAVPPKAQMTEVKTAVKGAQAFDIKVDCIGAPVSGYFGRPVKAAAKSLPAILFVHGAGVRSSNPGSVYWTEQQGGMLALDINAHGIENGKPASFYTDLANGALKDYRSVGRGDREKNYFLGMFLRLIRAIDFLTAQPEWDGKTLIVYGSSQGGFQALAAAGLDERVSYLCAGVPAGCDHTGIAVDRINGWPKMVTITDGKPAAEELQTARYFDAMNFATRAKAKGAAVTVGFIDTTCPPTSVYAAYNALTIPKQIHTDVLSGHTNTPAASKFMQEAAYAHVRAMK
jgi:cephalosporin-C deacetylase